MQIRKPNRVTHTYTQHLHGTPARVFPLICPVLEAEWLEGWDPRVVLTDSGVAEQDCVFTTAASSNQAVWFITRHEPDTGFIEMLKITPGVTACKLTFRLTPSASGTDAQITYSHTSLGPEGDTFVAGFDEPFYLEFMRDWEHTLNHYLETGKQLRQPAR